jgi:hypothetical protein
LTSIFFPALIASGFLGGLTECGATEGETSGVRSSDLFGRANFYVTSSFFGKPLQVAMIVLFSYK